MSPRLSMRHAPFGVAGVLGFAALVTLIWPTPDVAPTVVPRAETYGGVEHDPRFTVPRVGATPVRLTGSARPEIAAVLPVTGVPTLVGLMGGRDAYLRSAASGEVSRVSLGDALDGWRLVSIRGRAVTLQQGDHERTVALYARRGSAEGTATRQVDPPPTGSPPPTTDSARMTVLAPQDATPSQR